MQVGAATLIVGPITLGTFPGAVRRIRLGARCFVNSHVFIDASAPVWVGDHVSIGHHVVIVTTNHAIGPAYHRAGRLTSAPVTIESGAWVAAGALLLPGVTVGSGAVVAAGAVVASDVPAHTLVAGVPAKVIRHLDDETQGRDTPHDTQQIGTDRCI
jgi:acetyltransferase-like isoleucine patch superfamily enzyme